MRFNWPFYLLAGCGVVGLVICWLFWSSPLFLLLAALVSLPTIGSLVVSWWVYDASPLYALPFLDDLVPKRGGTIVSLTAGLDEVSSVLREKCPDCHLKVYDFYDESVHSEASIRRARAVYPMGDHVGGIRTDRSLPVEDGTVDLILGFMSLHEIRNRTERVRFLAFLRSALSDEGRLVVTEHVRDLANGLAFTLGVFHFHSVGTWRADFAEAGLGFISEERCTPFVRTFVLCRA